MISMDNSVEDCLANSRGREVLNGYLLTPWQADRRLYPPNVHRLEDALDSEEQRHVQTKDCVRLPAGCASVLVDHMDRIPTLATTKREPASVRQVPAWRKHA
jgi:hypothetical protein